MQSFAAPLPPSPVVAPPDELAVAIYEHMVLARTLDERIGALPPGSTGGHDLTGDGAAPSASVSWDEATELGAVAAMHDEDWVFPSSRQVAAALWRGMPLGAYAHHLVGSADDVAHGRNAPDPPFWKAARVASVSPLAGTHIPHAVGLAWAARVRKADVVSLVFVGGGAASSGDFHTGMNFAGVTRAPVVVVCCGSGRGAGDGCPRGAAGAGFAAKAVAYGLVGVQVDGGDAIAVLTAVREARARAASGHGGTLLEAVVSRVEHGAGSEVAGRADPLARMRAHLEERALWTAEREQMLAHEVRADVDRALAEARAAARPARESLFEDVYARPPWSLREQRAQGAPRESRETR